MDTYDTYDYLDIDSEDEEIIFVEEKQEVIQDFDSTTSFQNILKLMSKNNDIQKNPKWWANKANSILSLIDKNESKDINVTPNKIIPFINVKKIIHDAIDGVIEDPEEFWNKFQEASQAEKDKLFNPNTVQGINTSLPLTKMILDSDCVMMNENSMSVPRRILKNDEIVIEGYYSIAPNSNKYTYAKHITIDIDMYEKNISNLVVNQTCFLDSTKTGIVKSKNKNKLKIECEGQMILFDTSDWSKNDHFLYSIEFPKKISKRDLLKHNVLAKGVRAKDFLTLSSNDLLKFYNNKYLKNVIYDENVDKHLLDSIKENLKNECKNKRYICERVENIPEYFTNTNENSEKKVLKQISDRTNTLLDLAVRNNKQDLNINPSSSPIDYHFIWSLDKAKSGKNNVLIIPHYLYIHKTKNESAELRPGAVSFFSLKETKHGWDLDKEINILAQENIDFKDLNEDYFRNIQFIIKYFDDGNHRRSNRPLYKRNIVYETEKREGLDIRGILETIEINEIAEQSFLRDIYTSDGDDELEFDDENEEDNTIPQNIQTELEYLEVNTDILTRADMKELKILGEKVEKIVQKAQKKQDKTRELQFIIAYLIILSQNADFSFFKNISYQTVISYPENDEEINSYILEKLGRISESPKLIKGLYDVLLSKDSTIKKNIFEKKQVLRKPSNVNFNKENKWFSFEKSSQQDVHPRQYDVVLKLNKKSQHIKQYKPQQQQTTKDDSHDLPLNLSALVNILCASCTQLNNDSIFSKLKTKIESSVISEISYALHPKIVRIQVDSKQLKSVAKSLANFIKNDLKSIFGKIFYKYVIKSNKEHFEESIIEFLNDENVVSTIGLLLSDLLCAHIYFVNDSYLELIFILKYIVSLAIKDLPSKFQDILVDKLEKKLRNDLLTVESIRLEYEKQRENKKSRQMEAFQSMDQDIRKMTKQLIDLNILDKEENTLKRFI